MSIRSIYSSSGRWYAYVCGPIDSWPLWVRVADLVAQPGRINDRCIGTVNPAPDPAADAREFARELNRLAQVLDEVSRAAVSVGWEGDGEWMVGPLPTHADTEMIFAVTQQNDGATFVISPRPLPWFE